MLRLDINRLSCVYHHIVCFSLFLLLSFMNLMSSNWLLNSLSLYHLNWRTCLDLRLWNKNGLCIDLLSLRLSCRFLNIYLFEYVVYCIN